MQPRLSIRPEADTYSYILYRKILLDLKDNKITLNDLDDDVLYYMTHYPNRMDFNGNVLYDIVRVHEVESILAERILLK